MPTNIFVDLNVILDVLLERPGFKASQGVLQLSESIAVKLCISAHTVTTFAYLLESAKLPKNEITRQLFWLLQTFNVIATDATILEAALHSTVDDYEDAVVEQAAIAAKSLVIVTRNVKDFKNSAVPAMTPSAFLNTTTAKITPE